MRGGEANTLRCRRSGRTAYGGASPSAPTMLKKIGAKWYVLSEKTKKSLGDYSTKKDAKKRLGQVEFFKRLKQTRGIKEGRKGRQY